MINLTLTESQASYLIQVLDCVGGNPKGPRGEIDIVRHRLWNEFSKIELDPRQCLYDHALTISADGMNDNPSLFIDKKETFGRIDEI